ncbi:hypothetical protein H4R34_006140, partial [Dimargaris verticillata]
VPAISTQSPPPLGSLRKPHASPTVRQFHPLITPNATATPEPTLMTTSTMSSHLKEQNRALREEEGRVLRKAKEVMGVLIASPGLQSSDSSSESDLELLNTNSVQADSASLLETPNGCQFALQPPETVHDVVGTSSETPSPANTANRQPHALVTEDQASSQGSAKQQFHLSESASSDSPSDVLPTEITAGTLSADIDSARAQPPSKLTYEASRTPAVRHLVTLSQRAHRSMSNPAPFTKRINSEPLALLASNRTMVAPGGNTSGGPLQYLTRRLSRATANSSPKVLLPESGTGAASAPAEAMPRSASVDGKHHHHRPRRQRALSWQYLLAEDSMAFAGALLEDISGEELKTK